MANELTARVEETATAARGQGRGSGWSLFGAAPLHSAYGRVRWRSDLYRSLILLVSRLGLEPRTL